MSRPGDVIVPKFLDDPVTCVDDAVQGVCMLNPRLKRIDGTNVVVATEADPSKVLLLCGGGSGHEPAHVGFVARGWLSAAVCGSVFASPPTSHVSAAIQYLADLQGHHGAGILVIIKNYAGDILNFEFAVRQAREQGIRVETVLSADDVAFGDKNTSRRRGTAGCCLLYKILGAAAAQGKTLAQLKVIADRVNRNIRTLSASLSSCALPGSPVYSTFPRDAVEIGLGIHGEKGMKQTTFMGAREVTRRLMSVLIGRRLPGEEGGAAEEDEEVADVTPLPAGSKVILLVNNLGGTTDIEMNVVTAHAMRFIESSGLTVVGASAGRYMTSLDMHGFSITILNVEDEGDLSYMLQTRSLQARLMKFHVPHVQPKVLPGPLSALELAQQEAAKHGTASSDHELAHRVAAVFEALATKDVQTRFNAMDAEVGDGDMGAGVHRAATAVLPLLPLLPWAKDLSRCFALISKAFADACGGTCGPLYGALLLGAGAAAAKALSKGGLDALRAGVAGGTTEMQALGGAGKGGRTMVDVLLALVESEALAQADSVAAYVRAAGPVARAAADAVMQMPAQFGRSRYLKGREVGKPDPGAEMIVFVLEQLAKAF